MAIQLLRDIRGLRVQVIHANDHEGMRLVEHLRRIGCAVDATWPMPESLSETTELALVALDHEDRGAVSKLLSARLERPPALIAIVGYEDPATLQMVLESGALAVIERPVRPFGLLTQIALARSLWLDRQAQLRQIAKLERKMAGVQKIQKAKAILMANQGITEEEAYQSLRRQAMSKRMAMDEMATAIINAHELLHSRPGRA